MVYFSRYEMKAFEMNENGLCSGVTKEKTMGASSHQGDDESVMFSALNFSFCAIEIWFSGWFTCYVITDGCADGGWLVCASLFGLNRLIRLIGHLMQKFTKRRGAVVGVDGVSVCKGKGTS